MTAERRIGPVVALASTVFGAVGAQIAGAVASVVTVGALVALGGSTSPADLERAARSFAVLAVSGVAVGATLLSVAAGVPLAVGARPAEALGLRPTRGVVVLAATLGTLGLGPTADAVMSWFAAWLPDFTLGTVPQLNEVARSTSLLVLWPVLALVPGFCEELFFRGMLQRALGRGVLAIGVSAVAFALIHLDPHHVVGVLPLGLWLAWVAARADSSWPTITAHVANNTLAVVATHVAALDRGYGSAAGPIPWPWIPGGLALTACCAAIIVLATRTRRAAGPEA